MRQNFKWNNPPVSCAGKRFSAQEIIGNVGGEVFPPTFTYDNLERLKTVTGPRNLSMDYDSKGNITEKSDVGDVFGYTHPTKPYALTDIETSTGLVPEVLQTVTYTSFEQPLVITESPYQATFTYNSEGQRAKMEVKQSGSTIQTRWYAGSRYIKETEGANTKQYTWIGGDAYTAPCVAIKTNSGAQVYYYLLRDYLGNITHQLDMSNNVVAEYSFDAWGRRRDKDDWTYTLNGEPELLASRGFTSHEWLPWFNLYNMNGRLYDPVVGRFLSADNYVQMPDNTQNFNRYSYALNNPLKYYDPTGEKWKWKWLNPFYWFDELMQWINDETEPLRDKMVEAGIPDFGVGVSVNGDGNVNVSGSYRGQEVFNTGNIDKSNASQKVNQIINDVRQAHGQEWHASSGGYSMGLPFINGTTAPWNNEVIIEKYNQILKYIDGTNQTAGYVVALTGLAVEDIKFLESVGKTTFFVGIGIAAMRTDWSKTQSVVEFGIGGGLSTWGYLYPWAIPFAGVYSAVAIDKNYSKSLPERATSGYKSSNQQIRNHPYFKNLDW